MVRYLELQSGQGSGRRKLETRGAHGDQIRGVGSTPRPESAQALAIIVPERSIRPGGAASAMLVPRLIADAGENASLRFLDFFTANIRNPNTRAAYAVAVRAFFAWLDAKHVAPLAAVRTHHVSAYVEVLGRRYRAPTVKQHLAAIRMLFDWLIVGQIFAGPNPAAAVRGPKHVVKKGKTSGARRRRGEEAARQHRRLDDRRPARPGADRAAGLHLRARLGGAAHERRGLLSAGQTLVGAAARERRQAARNAGAPPARTLSRRLSSRAAPGESASSTRPRRCSARSAGAGASNSRHARMARQDARRMIVRRALAAGIVTKLGCHTFRATGITVYLLNGGLLEYAQQMAAHESARTTKLYDRRNDQVTLDQVERIVL